VLGVDLSRTQLELARHNVPSARFIKADMATIELPPASFDAVTRRLAGRTDVLQQPRRAD
jgi:ubiquinone/menaquinone biosynthesis C-methylase UbiE